MAVLAAIMTFVGESIVVWTGSPSRNEHEQSKVRRRFELEVHHVMDLVATRFRHDGLNGLNQLDCK